MKWSKPILPLIILVIVYVVCQCWVSVCENALNKPLRLPCFRVAVHRRMSYPHIHQPLRSLSSRSLKVHKPARVKKKKKKKMQSFPSRGAIQAPTIPEEMEEYEVW